jgi:hypothetical protein
MNETKKWACKDCVFWQALPKVGTTMERGECRRYAPRAKQSSLVVWPQTYAQEWCGDWRTKE